MEENPFSQSFCFEKFMKAAQYFSNMPANVNIYKETVNVITQFFKADIVFFAVERLNGELFVPVSTSNVSSHENVFLKCGEFIKQVLETSFLSLEVLEFDSLSSMVFLPIVKSNQTVAVLVVGYQYDKPLPKEILNVYLGLSGLIGSMIEKQFSQQQFQTMAENVPEMLSRWIVFPDQTKKFEYVSKGSNRVLGLSPDLIMHNDSIFFDNIESEDQAHFLQKADEALKKEGQLSTSFRWIDQSGKIRYILINAKATISENTGVVWDAALQDITDIKTAEFEILKLNEELEQRVIERTSDLAKAIQEAEVARNEADNANRAKSSFLATMSHELRTPLNAIIGFSQLMTRSSSLTKEIAEYLKIITRSGEHLLNLINDILDMSKIEAGRIKLNKDNFDLWRLLDDLESMLSLRAKEKNIRLLFERFPDVPQYIKTDEAKLRQILINLLNNALKFTQEGGVSLRVKKSDQYLHFEIEDTGIGIPANELGDIFKPFVQSQRKSKQLEEGTGLGLSISKKFAHLMGGDMTVQSELNWGSVFEFYIQAEAVKTSDIKIDQKPKRVIGLEPGQPEYRVLIVDDKWDNRQLLIKLLQPIGFEVNEAENGKEAIDIYHKWQPQLILMDMRMPVMDGYEATQKIKQTTKGQAVAIIAVTASTFEDERTVVISSGCDDFVRKPFREADIFDAISRNIGVRFVYEDIHNFDIQKDPEAIISDELTVLPVELLSNLEQAVIQIDMHLIDEILKKINEQHKALSEKISQLIDDYEYDHVLELINEAKESQ
ncbi:two-component hybrid sensor and regulator [Candidatus Magnetomorum sp. HK-1]|nr:two-component hybrid sensor and regulator [Candidatus Magnetomorum sp. HK-1]